MQVSAWIKLNFPCICYVEICRQESLLDPTNYICVQEGEKKDWHSSELLNFKCVSEQNYVNVLYKLLSLYSESVV